MGLLRSIMTFFTGAKDCPRCGDTGGNFIVTGSWREPTAAFTRMENSVYSKDGVPWHTVTEKIPVPYVTGVEHVTRTCSMCNYSATTKEPYTSRNGW